MAELDEIFYLTTLDQVHTLADPLRVRILERLIREPMTVKMLGTDLGEPPAKVHYHVREMERIGVIRLVETREKGGVLEKYYRAVAKSFSVSKDLLHTSPPDEVSAIFEEYLQVVQRGIVSALQHYRDHPDRHEPVAISTTTMWATQDEFRAFLDQISKMIDSYQAPRGVENEQEWTISVIGHIAAPEKEAADEPSEPAKIRRSYGVGAFDYKREDLAGLVAEGRQLDLIVVGMCTFADDITPDLVDRAIARVRVYGVMHASPAVRAALQRKGGERSQPA
jgi:DNA-binding transcriptional ArsR family regulator